jgi:glycosyltransferase involved in cell wall biosynthesis
MRNGVAVIGTNAGGVPEIIKHGETGLLFEPKNSDELTQQLWRLYKDSNLREKLALAGKHYADEHFNQERHYDSLVTLIEGVVQSV